MAECGGPVKVASGAAGPKDTCLVLWSSLDLLFNHLLSLAAVKLPVHGTADRLGLEETLKPVWLQPLVRSGTPPTSSDCPQQRFGDGFSPCCLIKKKSVFV